VIAATNVSVDHHRTRCSLGLAAAVAAVVAAVVGVGLG